MAVGPWARKMLTSSPRLTKALTDAYRGFFVDLKAVAELAPVDQRRSLLNVGTGDGELLNTLARQYPSLAITSTDISDEQGWLIADDVRERVTLITRTPEQIQAEGFGGAYDVVLLSDVIHHVPVADRRTVLGAAWAAVAPGGVLVVKDIEDRGLKSVLSLWSDKYVTGDRHTQLIGLQEMTALLQEVTGSTIVRNTALLQRNFPNYMVTVPS